ncbi:MAG: GNAT family N-acetyltransferase [Pseudonocardiales bacterium]|nr:MAG: GNAT family N-acetyltransferase [Pseudonocardiales bacterium]
MTEALSTMALRADARAAAAEVAEARGLTVCELGDDPAEHRTVEHLLSRIWSTGKEPSPMPGEIMRMLSYTGSYVAGAYRGNRLVGAGVGFLTDTLPDIGAAHLHSHVVGVAAEARGRQVGFALKLHQRAWALEHGFDRVTWTFDPLVRRNAYFNLCKLGASAVRYLVDFYGDMPDGLNTGQGSDRLLVEWQLNAPEVAAAAAGTLAQPDARFGRDDVTHLLRCAARSVPVLAPQPRRGPAVCEIPPDIEAVRDADPELGVAWRRAVRSVLSAAMSDGTRIAGFDRTLGYLLLDDGDIR